MKGVVFLVLCLLNVRLSRSCYGEGNILFCLDIPQAFSPGFSSLVMALKDVGEINSTVFRSNNLSSITRLRFEGAGVTGIAEGAFRSLQNLTDLSLNQNQLTHINPHWFSQPGVLSELSLTENHITVLNVSMCSELNNLTRLSLNKNMIREIHPNTFSSMTSLAELDLSDNRMTWVSPQVFRSLRSTRISLDGNPWDCSCEARDFVDYLKDLQSASRLNKPSLVTCESPPSLRGRPVWNVSVCVTPPTSTPPTETQTVQPKPTHIHQTSTAKEPITSSPKPSTHAATTNSSHSVTPPAPPPSLTKTSNPPGPTHLTQTVTTLTSETGMFGTHWTPSPSVTEVSVSIDPKPSDPPRPVSTPTGTGISDHPTPSDPPRTSPPPTGETAVPDTCLTSQPSSGTNIVCTLVAVIAVLASLLFVVCFLVVHRRKRSNKTVAPGKEGRDEAGETSSGSSRSLDQTEKTRHNENDHSDTEAGWRRAFNGVRAKSANAILSTLPFCAPVKDQVTFQSETKAPKPGDETELDEGAGTENQSKKTEVNAEKDVDENPPCVSPHADTVPYLSIGTNQNETSPGDLDKQSKDGQNERSVMDKVMSRISTWPLTAMQWQTRCKMTEEKEEKVTEVFTVLTPELQGDLKKDFHKVKHPLDTGEAETEDGSGKNPQDECLTMNPAHMNLCSPQSSKPKVNATFQRPKKEDKIQDQRTTLSSYKDKAGRSKDLKPAERSTKKSSRGSNKAEQRNESKRAETSGQREANRSSKAPSGGASPDDETLLSGNEYAFMDLLHEVVQNNGRWTRERWRQTRGNKQRR